MKKTIFLIHGWDYDNYYGRTTEEAWHNRNDFVKELQKVFNVYLIDLPSFGKNPLPKEKMWTLDDFAKYIQDYITEKKLKIDYVLGYSFGGAVGVRWKKNYESNTKLCLVSPAIIRNQEKSKTFISTPKFFNPLRNLIRDLYLIYIIKNPEMKYGDAFHRRTYQNIVRLDLTKELENIKPEDLLIIFGENDNMVNPTLLKKNIAQKYKKIIIMLQNGGHDIANTHTNELISEIEKWSRNA